MSITETRIGLSPDLYDIFECFTPIRTHKRGIVSIVLVTREELRRDPLYWTRIDNKYHTVELASLDDACEAVEFYARKFPSVVNTVAPGVPTARLNLYKESHGTGSRVTSISSSRGDEIIRESKEG